MELYYDKPYDQSFEAEVIEIGSDSVVLDGTLFYPEGGGQPSDTGDIEGIRVVRVEKADGIRHILESAPQFKVGDRVTGKIDWNRRYRIMRIHTCLHLLTNLCDLLLAAVSHVGSGMSDEKGHIDIYYALRITPKVRERITSEANTAIEKGAEVKTWFEGPVRHVRITGFPPLKCGGTHLRNIAEIGQVALKRDNIGSGKDRLEVHLIQ